MAERIQNPDGTITWRYKNLQELLDYMEEIAQNPTYLDEDLELKDRRDSWRD